MDDVIEILCPRCRAAHRVSRPTEPGSKTTCRRCGAQIAVSQQEIPTEHSQSAAIRGYLARPETRGLSSQTTTALDETTQAHPVPTLLTKRQKVLAFGAVALAGALIVVLAAMLVWAQSAKNRAVRAEREQRRAALAVSKRFAMEAVQAADARRWAEAEDRAADAKLVCPDGPWALYARGRFSQAKGRHEAACKLFRRALKAGPGEKEIEAALERSLTVTGGTEWVQKSVANLAGLKDWHVAAKLGDALLRGARWQDARRAFSRCLKLMGADVPPEERSRADHGLGEANAWIACEGFAQAIRNLSPEEQVRRVRAKLEEIHGKPIKLRKFVFEEGAWASVDLAGEPVDHLAPFKGLSLRAITAWNCSGIRDLTPLRGMPLKLLDIRGTSVSDLTPLTGMKLEELSFTPKSIARGIGVIRNMESIRTISVDGVTRLAPPDFWKGYDAGQYK